ncbi:hypothetical protein K8I85_01280 [bacterium]|nr:hypothetical protein [bacterium]
MLFLVSSAACLATTVLSQHVGNWIALWTLPWAIRVGTHVAIVFLAPSLVLGMISPLLMNLVDQLATGYFVGSMRAPGRTRSEPARSCSAATRRGNPPPTAKVSQTFRRSSVHPTGGDG